MHTHSLGVEHAGANDELEDVLQSFESSQNCLTVLALTGDIQVPLQHRHQLPVSETKDRKAQMMANKVQQLLTFIEQGRIVKMRKERQVGWKIVLTKIHSIKHVTPVFKTPQHAGALIPITIINMLRLYVKALFGDVQMNLIKWPLTFSCNSYFHLCQPKFMNKDMGLQRSMTCGFMMVMRNATNWLKTIFNPLKQ